jgi:hypothetical protein
MERSRHASHLASRSYRGGIPDLGGGEEGSGDGVGAGAAGSGDSAMARVSAHEEKGADANGGGRNGAAQRDAVTGKAAGCLQVAPADGLIRMGWAGLGPAGVQMI